MNLSSTPKRGTKRDKAAILLGILFGSEIAAAAPRLVADSPELNVERLAFTCSRSLI